MPGENIPTEIPVDLGDLSRQWGMLDDVYRQYDALPPNATGPDLFDRYMDEQQTAGHRVYIAAAAHIDNAREHNDVLRLILTQIGPTPRVPWSMMRSVFESGFWSNWLLESHDGVTRRQRGLRLEILGHLERRRFYTDYLRAHQPELRKQLAQIAEHEKKYRAEAESIGLDWDAAVKKIDIVQELDKLKVVSELEPDLRGQAVATWRSLSGAQHGHTYALIHFSDLVEKGEVIGGKTGMVTISDSALQIAGTVSYILHMRGLALFVTRSTSSSKRA
jgi:hypothetical protein